MGGTGLVRLGRNEDENECGRPDYQSHRRSLGNLGMTMTRWFTATHANESLHQKEIENVPELPYFE